MKFFKVFLLIFCVFSIAGKPPKKYTDDETAIKDIARKLKKQPRNAALLFQFGWFMQKRNFHRKAEEYYQKCLSVDEKYSPALVNLGNLYARQKKMNIAEKYFLRALKYSANAPEVHYNLGTFYLKKKDYSKAILRFEKAVELNPQSKEAYLNLARIHLYFYSEKPDPQQIAIAKEYLIIAAKISNQYPHVYFNLGRIYEIENKKGIALEYYRKASSLFPKDSKYQRLSIQKINKLK